MNSERKCAENELRAEYIKAKFAGIGPLVIGLMEQLDPEDIFTSKKYNFNETDGAHPLLLLREADERALMNNKRREDMESALSKLRKEVATIVEMSGEQGRSGPDIQNVLGRIYVQIVNLEYSSRQLSDSLSNEGAHIIDAAENPVRDPKTGMATGKGQAESMALRLRDINKLEDQYEQYDRLDDISIKVSDMMLFHTGIAELGEEFDARLKDYFTAGLIIVAEFLAKGREGLYWEKDENDLEKNVVFNLYFPKGSEIRKKLEEIKRLGIIYEPARLNPGGGDEFNHCIITNVNRNDVLQDEMRKYGKWRGPDCDNINQLVAEERGRRIALVDDVISYVITNTTFSKDRPVILADSEKVFSNEEVLKRRKMFAYFCNSLNDTIPAENVDAEVTEEMSQFFYDFKDELRKFFLSEDVANKYFVMGSGLLNPQVDLRMDEAVVGSIFNYPNLHDMERYVLANERYVVGSEKNKEFLAGIKNIITKKLSEEEIKNKNVFFEKATIEIYKEMFAKFQDHLFGLVNGESKKRKKLDVLTMAGRGDAQSIFTVGSVRESGRVFVDLDDSCRRELWSNLISYWIGEYDIQTSNKLKGIAYNSTLVDGSFGKYLRKTKKYMLANAEDLSENRWQWVTFRPSHTKGENFYS